MLRDTVAAVDNGLFHGSWGSRARAEKLQGYFSAELPTAEMLDHPLTVIYISRTDFDEKNQSTFHIWELARPESGPWDSEELHVPTVAGPPHRLRKGDLNPVYAWGSGGHLLVQFPDRELGVNRALAAYTCAYFRTLFQALKAHHDPLSGGPVQLVILMRGQNGQHIGIIKDGKKYVGGKIWAAPPLAVSRWVNEDFDECDPDTLQKRTDRKLNPR